ncbi:restriction endonuclease subunit S [Aliarcobacter butzleri]|uniref:Restriction endonuclease subunit S n=1 Tax=Aliarcobacter butzleri TaxID=28197 RepID=A0AAW6VSA7_9BACT|nr:restriction endonuclease subunit S [Aliarcobacter butzleri]MDK2063089.1 restriction endonuclease subunit S [Aliarcobacter butzleri]
MNRFEKYSSYKDSGVEWLGEIPEHWESQKMKYLGKMFAGLTDKKGDDFAKEISEDKMPFIPFTNVCNNLKIDKNQMQYVKIKPYEKQNKVQKNDIIFLMSSETLDDIGKCSIHLDEEQFYLNSFCKGFRPKTFAVNAEFLNYLLQSKTYRNYFALVGRGFTRINIKQEYINDLFTVLPLKEEQTKIASFLDEKTAKIDEVISQKQKLIELLKERKQIVINDAVTKGLDKDVEFVDSGVEWIGKIPKHWEISKLGTSLKPISIKNRADLPLLSVTREQGVILRDVDDKESNHNFIPDDLSGYKMVEKGQFAMNKMKAWQGSYGISDYTGIVSPAYFIFELNGIEPTFFHKAIRSSVYVPFFIKASDGVRIGQWDLSKSRMKEIPFYIPPKEEQIKIVEYIENQTTKIDKAIELQQNYILKLKEYKASLIDSVVTGKVRVA